MFSKTKGKENIPIAFGFENGANVQFSKGGKPVPPKTVTQGKRDKTFFPVLHSLSCHLPINHMINIILGVIL